MTELQFHSYLVAGTFALAVATFVSLLFVTAPYGRHARGGWGPDVSARLGWVAMESPSVIVFATIYFLGDQALQAAPLVLFALWQIHYLNRAFVFPFRLHATSKRVPVLIASMAILFNCLNSYINARWVSQFSSYSESWLTSTPFLIGMLCFVVGWSTNQHADAVLLRLRSPDDGGYKIPRGGLYRWVSCPNYLGEMLEWVGWAIATWSLAGAAFAVFTIANLLPRAIAHHRWYRQQFAEYPRARRALIPYLL